MEKASEILEAIGKLMAHKPEASILEQIGAYQKSVELLEKELSQAYNRGYKDGEKDFKKKIEHQILNN